MARNEVQYRMRCRTPAAIFAAVACLVLTFSQPAASLADDAMTARYNPEAETAGAGEIAAQAALPTARGISCDGTSVCREAATGLPFQVLPRSFSHVYRSKSPNEADIAVANIRPFAPLYVFGLAALQPPDSAAEAGGWYLVAERETGPALGWMQAVDLLEWRQALVVAYTHPGVFGEGRQRVLMFRQKSALLALLQSDDPAAQAISLYRRLAGGEVPPELISKEPERFVDISRDFYLLPIVDYEQIDWEGDEVRVLQLASALPGKRGADRLDDPTYRQAAMKKPEQVMETAVRGLNIDLVFVMDMTRSMQPYIDKTREAIRAIANRASEAGLEERIRYGLVGFRDDVALTPELEFTSRNFTPELLAIDAFENLLHTGIRASEKSSVGYAEEVFAGVDTALGSNWRPASLRFIVLVGDASSHPVGHAQNTTGKDAATLQLEADDAQVHIMALHLVNPAHPEDHEPAQRQYATLSHIRGSQNEAALVSLSTEDTGGFQAAVEEIGGSITGIVQRAQRGQLEDFSDLGPAPDSPAPLPEDPAGQAGKAVRAVINAAMMEYLGRDVDAPKDILAWTLDRDLTNPSIVSLDVRVLLNRRQLNDLILALDRVIQAMDRASISNKQFFTALQEVAGQTMKDPDALTPNLKLSQTGLLPAYIGALPYRSEILHLTEAMFASMTAELRSDLDSRLRAKLQSYRDISSDVDGWKSLYPGSAELDKVYPLRLDYLP
ncbi:MAG: VWA domain-containing protein [Gammaproteobacteria bacterium]|nr:VWA domain-containing protein [Gammaproteobacteria bacterium]